MYNIASDHKLFTSESVTEGHPDKLCDCISDSILDALLAQDPNSRCACETTAEPGGVKIMGEITSKAQVDYEAVARQTIRQIGYTDPALGFDADHVPIQLALHQQSPDIALGVDAQGAGDQGMMFGFACDETQALMPLPIQLAHSLARRLTEVRKTNLLPWLRPDGKSQVTVEYDEARQPIRVHAIVLSAQHDAAVDRQPLENSLLQEVITPTIPAELLNAETKIYINPTGRFVLGGPAADTGLTGRKIIVDTYGGYARHGGGAFSGKDPTKVDRSAAYMARYLAKNVVAAGLARRCEVQLAYAIGVASPVSVRVDTFGTGIVSDDKIAGTMMRLVDLTPCGIIKRLALRRPIYRRTAAYGHFGDNAAELPWEQQDLALDLRKALIHRATA